MTKCFGLAIGDNANPTTPKSVAEWLAGERVQMPPSGVTFKQAEKVKPKPDAEQPDLGL